MFHKTLSLVALLLVGSSALIAQPAAAPNPTPVKIDINSLMDETQKSDLRENLIGIFLWVPTDYWIASAGTKGISAAQAEKTFGALRDYTMFVVGAGSTSINTINWNPEENIRKNVVLRDRAGTTYKPLEKVSANAEAISTVIKPIFKNILGPMAEGLHILYFPARDSSGKLLADPYHTGEFSLDVSNLMGSGTSSYSWQLPLNSMLPPKYCPVGKERIA